MKRKIGIIALIMAGISIILSAMMQIYADAKISDMIPFILLYCVGCITAIICLIGDVIRFVGKCFSQGFSAGNAQECGRVCPLCGKAISGNARFCSECGCELTQNS